MKLAFIFKKKYQLGFLVIVALWGEWISYVLYARLFWPEVNIKMSNILLVADPQLIGYMNENWLIGWLTRWDSDRYLRRGYSIAKEHTKTKSIIFLGDLIDEGVDGTPEQFQWSVTRFASIFPFEEGITKRIYIAGDNDIGGELEPVWDRLKSRFKTSFPNKVSSDHELTDFDITEINFFEWPPKHFKILNHGRADAIQILLSHDPISPAMRLTNKVVREIDPDLILSAHDHSNLMSCDEKYLLAAFCPICYVGLVILFDLNGIDRNLPDNVRRRMCAAVLTSAISVTLTYRLLNGDWEAMGFRSDGILKALTYPTVPILLLYTGQLVLFYFDGQFSNLIQSTYWKNCVSDMTWIRDVALAPITEEIVFRSCSASLVASCLTKWQTIFLAPMFFGLAHLHHIVSDIRYGYSLRRAVLRRTFQLGYTYVFGAYATYLLLSTKSIIAPILTHTICNVCGLPLFGEIENFSSRWQRRAIWGSFIVGIIGFAATVGPLTDTKLFL